MPRCRKARCCREIPGEIIYKPVGIPLHNLQTVDLALDEYEVFLLCDYEGLDQTAAGQRMGVSRGTIQRLLAATRHKIAGALANGQAVRIMPEQKLGGNV